MQHLCLVVVGNEILSGKITDRNSAYLADSLTRFGFLVSEIVCVRDDLDALACVIESRMKTYPLVITTGGLGPTVDDLTRDAISQATSIPLNEDESLWKALQHYFAQRGIQPNTSNRSQTLVPTRDGGYFPNECGTAPGLWFQSPHGHIVVALPGPPRELIPMWEHQVRPWLFEQFPVTSPVIRTVLRFCGVGESQIDEIVRPLLKDCVDVRFECLFRPALVDVTLTMVGESSSGQGTIEQVTKALQHHLRSAIYAYASGVIPPDWYASTELHHVLIKRLVIQNLSLSVAESCTGGLVGGMLTEVAGSSKVFAGGIIAYSNQVKQQQLGVSRDILQQHGAVSAETAGAMAIGVQKCLDTDIGLSLTGIAGPDGGSLEKPVGTVWLGLKVAGHAAKTKLLRLAGTRADIRERACVQALHWVLAHLSS